jgi:cobalt-zinc-cadmium efflux system protein
MKEVLELFLEKTPHGIEIHELEEHICEIPGVLGVHHVHVWSLDGQSNYATMHIVTNEESHGIKHKIREELREHGIGHATLELEREGEHCHEEHCHVETEHTSGHHHHHHHHHH